MFWSYASVIDRVNQSSPRSDPDDDPPNRLGYGRGLTCADADLAQHARSMSAHARHHANRNLDIRSLRDDHRVARLQHDVLRHVLLSDDVLIVEFVILRASVLG